MISPLKEHEVAEPPRDKKSAFLALRRSEKKKENTYRIAPEAPAADLRVSDRACLLINVML